MLLCAALGWHRSACRGRLTLLWRCTCSAVAVLLDAPYVQMQHAESIYVCIHILLNQQLLQMRAGCMHCTSTQKRLCLEGK